MTEMYVNCISLFYDASQVSFEESLHWKTAFRCGSSGSSRCLILMEQSGNMYPIMTKTKNSEAVIRTADIRENLKLYFDLYTIGRTPTKPDYWPSLLVSVLELNKSLYRAYLYIVGNIICTCMRNNNYLA